MVNNSKLLFTGTDSYMYSSKTEDIYKDFSKDKEMFGFSNCQAESKFYYDSNKLLFCKMKNETGGAAIKEFVGLKTKIYLFLVDDSSEHKKAERVNKNFVATINHGEYKDILSIEICFRHRMNRIESKDTPQILPLNVEYTFFLLNFLIIGL